MPTPRNAGAITGRVQSGNRVVRPIQPEAEDTDSRVGPIAGVTVMQVVEKSIQRLGRAELTATPYQQLAQALFGPACWEAHVRYCRWLYQQNPATRPDEPLPIYVFREGDVPVGQVGVIPVQVVFAGEPQRAGWCVDFFILPTHQRRGIGTALLTAAHEDFPLLMTLGQTSASYGLFIRRDWHEAGRLTLCKRLLRPLRGVSGKALRAAGLLGAANAVFGRTKRSSPRLPREVEVKPVVSRADFDDAILEQRRPPPADACICRSATFLRWRYFDNPFIAYDVRRLRLSAYAEAYAVWRVIDDGLWCRGTLVDLVYPADLGEATLRRLTRAVLECMRAEGADVFECRTSDPALLAALPNELFSTRQSGARFLYRRTGGSDCPLIPVERWRLYAGDCDVDALAGREAAR